MTPAAGPLDGRSDDAALGAERADEALLGRLRAAARRYDAPPVTLTPLVASLHSWRDPDAELAALVADSRLLAGSVRAGGTDVLLRFEAASVAITLEAVPDGSGRYRLTGQVEPEGPGVLGVRHGGAPSAELSVECDEFGRFEAHPVIPGPVSLSFRRNAGAAVQTAWTVI